MISRRADQHTSPRGRRHPLRPDLNMTLIAKRLGCSPGHLTDILRGRRRLTEKMAPLLAQALGLPPDRVQSVIEAWAVQTAMAESRRAR